MEPVGLSDVPSLVAAVRRGHRPKYLMFWGHRPTATGSIGKECLSQWWPAPFVFNSDRYASAEHFMMAEKARLFGDDETRMRILRAPNPGAAKRLGREVHNFDEGMWAESRFDIVVRGSVAKFQQNPSLGQFLLGTKTRVLVEASPVDRIWGIGLAADAPGADNPEKWRGLNLLGFALMRARALLGNPAG
jgi:ribA/ribD-fused uncharacterized protein